MSPFFFEEHVEKLRERCHVAAALAALQEFARAYQGMNGAAAALQEPRMTGRLRPNRAAVSKEESNAQIAKFEADLIALDDLLKGFLSMEEVDSEASLAELRRMTAVLRRLEADAVEELRVLLERHGY